MLGPELGWIVRPIFMQSQVKLPLPSSQNRKPETALSLSLSVGSEWDEMKRCRCWCCYCHYLCHQSLLLTDLETSFPWAKWVNTTLFVLLNPLSLSLSLSLMHIILNFRINLSIFKIFNNFSPELCGTIWLVDTVPSTLWIVR